MARVRAGHPCLGAKLSMTGEYTESAVGSSLERRGCELHQNGATFLPNLSDEVAGRAGAPSQRFYVTHRLQRLVEQHRFAGLSG